MRLTKNSIGLIILLLIIVLFFIRINSSKEETKNIYAEFSLYNEFKSLTLNEVIGFNKYSEIEINDTLKKRLFHILQTKLNYRIYDRFQSTKSYKILVVMTDGVKYSFHVGTKNLDDIKVM